MSAEEDIRKTIAQSANSIDLKDWALMESALAEVITVDYSDLRGPNNMLGPPWPLLQAGFRYIGGGLAASRCGIIPLF